MKAVIEIPPEFVTSEMALASLRGSVIVQNSRGEILLIDSSNNSLLSKPITTFFKPTFAGE
jgi:hypothetical protein